MNDHLRLTAYFGDRQRRGDGFVADQLMALCAEATVDACITLRGAAGFGPRHVLRSDQSLSASEDLPVAMSAVDTADKMTGLADRASRLISRGLLTMERVSVGVTEATGDVEVTCRLGRRQQASGRLAHRTVCAVFHEHGFDSAIAFLGVDGTVAGQRRRARFAGANSDVPTLVVAVGSGARLAEALTALGATLPDAVVTVQHVHVCKRAGVTVAPPPPLPGADATGRRVWQKLVVHSSETDLVDGEPIHRALVRRLYGDPLGCGVTVLRGVWGFHGSEQPHGDKLFQFGRHVPVSTIIVEEPDRIAAHFAVVDELTARVGIVTAATVPALMSIDDDARKGGIDLADLD